MGDLPQPPRRSVWAPIVARYKRLVYSIAVRQGLDENDAANLSQEVWLLALERGDPPPEDRIVRYLASITYWKAREHHRRRGRPGGVPIEPPAEQVAEGDLPDDELARVEYDQKVFEAYQSLRQRHREVLDCLFYADPSLSYAETARVLGIALGSVGPIRARALEALRKALIERGLLES